MPEKKIWSGGRTAPWQYTHLAYGILVFVMVFLYVDGWQHRCGERRKERDLKAFAETQKEVPFCRSFFALAFPVVSPASMTSFVSSPVDSNGTNTPPELHSGRRVRLSSFPFLFPSSFHSPASSQASSSHTHATFTPSSFLSEASVLNSSTLAIYLINTSFTQNQALYGQSWNFDPNSQGLMTFWFAICNYFGPFSYVPQELWSRNNPSPSSAAVSQDDAGLEAELSNEALQQLATTWCPDAISASTTTPSAVRMNGADANRRDSKGSVSSSVATATILQAPIFWSSTAPPGIWSFPHWGCPMTADTLLARCATFQPLPLDGTLRSSLSDNESSNETQETGFRRVYATTATPTFLWPGEALFPLTQPWVPEVGEEVGGLGGFRAMATSEYATPTPSARKSPRVLAAEVNGLPANFFLPWGIGNTTSALKESPIEEEMGQRGAGLVGGSSVGSICSGATFSTFIFSLSSTPPFILQRQTYEEDVFTDMALAASHLQQCPNGDSTSTTLCQSQTSHCVLQLLQPVYFNSFLKFPGSRKQKGEGSDSDGSSGGENGGGGGDMGGGSTNCSSAPYSFPDWVGDGGFFFDMGVHLCNQSLAEIVNPSNGELIQTRVRGVLAFSPLFYQRLALPSELIEGILSWVSGARGSHNTSLRMTDMCVTTAIDSPGGVEEEEEESFLREARVGRSRDGQKMRSEKTTTAGSFASSRAPRAHPFLSGRMTVCTLTPQLVNLLPTLRFSIHPTQVLTSTIYTGTTTASSSMSSGDAYDTEEAVKGKGASAENNGAATEDSTVLHFTASLSSHSSSPSFQAEDGRTASPQLSFAPNCEFGISLKNMVDPRTLELRLYETGSLTDFTTQRRWKSGEPMVIIGVGLLNGATIATTRASKDTWIPGNASTIDVARHGLPLMVLTAPIPTLGSSEIETSPDLLCVSPVECSRGMFFLRVKNQCGDLWCVGLLSFSLNPETLRCQRHFMMPILTSAVLFLLLVVDIILLVVSMRLKLKMKPVSQRMEKSKKFQ